MNTSISYRVDTPCGFDIWIIPQAIGTLKFRVFWGSEEVGLEALNDKLSLQGAKLLASKLKEIAA